MHHAPTAIASAVRLGIHLAPRDYARIVLAITDAVAADGVRVSPLAAAYVGVTREAERWAVRMTSRSFDVLYEPGQAVVIWVVPGFGGGLGGFCGAVRNGDTPKPLTVPLKAGKGHVG